MQKDNTVALHQNLKSNCKLTTKFNSLLGEKNLLNLSILAKKLQALTLTHLSRLVSRDYISSLWGCWPSNCYMY